MNSQVKRAFRYRFYPTHEQAVELSRTFGCVRKVYNLALQARTEAWEQREERLGYEGTSALLTAWKRTEELAFPGEVSSVPLRQSPARTKGSATADQGSAGVVPQAKGKQQPGEDPSQDRPYPCSDH